MLDEDSCHAEFGCWVRGLGGGEDGGQLMVGGGVVGWVVLGLMLLLVFLLGLDLIIVSHLYKHLQ